MKNSPRPLEGKVSLVTGGNTGIGKGIAETFASAGSDVVIGHFVSPDSAADLARDLQSRFGIKAISTHADIRDSRDVRRMVCETREHFGRLDHLICNAAAQHCKPLLEMTDDEIAEIVNTNLVGTMFCVREGARLMLEGANGDRSALLVSSINATMPQLGLSVYGATKGGIESLTRGLSRELSPHIRVNAIQPGPTATERTLTNATYRRWGEVVPTGRVSEIEDVASAALFLASDAARNINGIVLPINGGLTNVRPTPADIQRG